MKPTLTKSGLPGSVTGPGSVEGQKLEKPVETSVITGPAKEAPAGSHTGSLLVQAPLVGEGERVFGLQAPRIKPRTGGRTSKVFRPKAELYRSAALKKNVRAAFQELYVQITSAVSRGGSRAEVASGLEAPLLAALKQVSGLRKRAKDIEGGVSALGKAGLGSELVDALVGGRLRHDAALGIRDRIVAQVKAGDLTAAEAKDALITLDDALLLFAATLGKNSKIGDFRYNHPQIGAGEAGNRASDVLNALASSMHR